MKNLTYYILILFGIFSIFTINANAETFVPPTIGVLINNTENFNPIAVPSGGISYNIKVAASDVRPAYFILDMCTLADYNNMTISNTGCTDSCISDGKLTTYVLEDYCYVGNYTGTHVLAQLKVNKYGIDPVSTYYQASSRITFGGYNYYTMLNITDYYASNIDVVGALVKEEMRYEELTNQNNTIINQNNQTNQKLDNVNNSVNNLNTSINDSSTSSPNNGINAVKNGLASNGVITQLITLPVTLFQQILNSINGTCQSFNLGSLFGTDLTMPCIAISNYLGNTLWGIIDVIISGYFVWVIGRKMISAFEMFSSMKDGDVLDD